LNILAKFGSVISENIILKCEKLKPTTMTTDALNVMTIAHVALCRKTIKLAIIK